VQIDKFDELLEKDKPNKQAIDIVNAYHQNNIPVVIVSGKRIEKAHLCSAWLMNNNINYHELILRRPSENTQPTAIIKQQIMAEIVRVFEPEIVMAYDDRTSVIEMYKDKFSDIVIPHFIENQ